MLGAALSGALFVGQAQSSLADLVEQGQAEWMMGTWVGTTDNGTTFTHSFSWDLDKQIILMRGEIGDRSFLGITSLDSSTGEPKYVGWDSKGSTSKGTWGEENDGVALRLESTRPGGETRKFAVVFAKTDGGNLEVRFHTVDEWGYLNYPAMGSTTLKKQAKKK